MATRTLAFLESLDVVIRQRLDDKAADSYTASLASGGERRVAQKVGEEAVELAIASVGGSRDEVLGEAADLVYHLLVLLAMRDLSLADVVGVLELRHTGR